MITGDLSNMIRKMSVMLRSEVDRWKKSNACKINCFLFCFFSSFILLFFSILFCPSPLLFANIFFLIKYFPSFSVFPFYFFIPSFPSFHLPHSSFHSFFMSCLCYHFIYIHVIYSYSLLFIFNFFSTLCRCLHRCIP